MPRPALSACVGLLLVLVCVPPATAGEMPALAAGNWKLSALNPPFYQETTFCILKVENKDGKSSASVLATHPGLRGLTLESFTVEKDLVRVALKGRFTFEGRISPKSGKTVLGALDAGTRLSPARLSTTDLATLTPKDLMTPPDLPPLKRLMELNSGVFALRLQALKEKDADKKADLQKQIEKAASEMKTQIPKLYDEILDKHADHPAALGIALSRIRDREVGPERVKALVQLAEKNVAPYGPRLQRQTQADLASALIAMPASKEFALEYTRRIADGLTDKDPASLQVEILKALRTAQTKLNQAAQAKQTAVRIAKLDVILDREYLSKVPPFKPETFKGRTGKGRRAVVMELFTGTQCPPCVAADVACDALEKSYRPTELILLEYHLHIPGPDPLTNKDSEARWAYYGKAFPADVRGTPTAVFNGKPEAGGGGGMDASQAKYDQYRKIIDRQVEEPEAATLSASAARRGNRIDIEVQVANLKDPGPEKKLRLVLVEESIRYVGGNRVRFHHQVVRALPGGADGMTLKDPTSTHKATVDLAELRDSLTRDLDDFAKDRAFANPDRPLDLRNLHLIALVQDDQTHEILQGIQVEVRGDKTAE